MSAPNGNFETSMNSYCAIVFHSSDQLSMAGSRKEQTNPWTNDTDAFGKLVNWMYADHVVCRECDMKKASGVTSPISEEHQLLWCRLCVLADKFSLFDLVSLVVEQIEFCLALPGYQWIVSPETISLVYKTILRVLSL